MHISINASHATGKQVALNWSDTTTSWSAAFTSDLSSSRTLYSLALEFSLAELQLRRCHQTQEALCGVRTEVLDKDDAIVESTVFGRIS